MKKFLFAFVINFICWQFSIGQQLKSPSEFLGYALGTQFTPHYQVINYFQYISENSSSVLFEKYGSTNENRPLYVSYISSANNIQNLTTIREDNLKRSRIITGTPTTEIGIVWLSYNVHGNEASSTEAAMLTLYKLISEKQEWLKNTIVIIDPCVNPDGRDRYVNWYNQVKNTPYNSNPDATEHHEPWPGGRPNHYLFDLNRDWAWATQVETQQRIKIYNKWMPQIHVDFHEQFINNPYYFAPGAEPYHEIITDWQREFQTAIGKNHATYFDKNGWLYFTKEFFDLLYPSYGDTYPTFMGAIGMTYEQAGHGMAGLGIVTENKTILTLEDRIAHHTTTGLSTVEMASKNTTKMLDEYKKFFVNNNLKYKNYIVRGSEEKIKQVIALLNKHEINSYFTSGKAIKVFDYNSNTLKTIAVTKEDLIIPTNQPKGKMVKALFEKDAKLTNNITYDITAWSVPYAYGLEGFATEIELQSYKQTVDTNVVTNEINKNAYAYIHTWNEVLDANFLGKLLEKEFNVRFSKNNFTVEGNSYNKGTLVIMRGENNHISNFDETIVNIANKLNTKLTTTSTGFVTSGYDFGSPSFSLIKKKNVAVLSGKKTESTSFGEIWHFFEQELQYPLTVINTSYFNRIDLSKYQVLILPSGYRADEKELEKITEFTSNGGTVIAIETALNSFADNEKFSLKKKKPLDNSADEIVAITNTTPYNERENEYIKHQITGSVFKSTIDNTHPLGFGYNNSYYSLKLSATAYQMLATGYNIGYFPKEAVNVSGFAGENALEQIPESLLFGIENKGSGSIIYMVDNPLFRDFWQNGKLFFANAVFLN